MMNRIELAQYFAELGFKRGVEVGLCEGRYSKILCENIPGLHLIGIDPYASYETDSVARDQNTNDNNLAKARQALTDYPDAVIVIGYGHDIAQWLPDESLDFVFIDGKHDYESVKQDIEDWTPKVRKGGIVSGHDYYLSKSGRLGIVRAVDEFIYKTDYELEVTEWDHSAYRDDQQPDWYFVK